MIYTIMIKLQILIQDFYTSLSKKAETELL